VSNEAVAHAAYLRNRAPTRALDGTTPYEAWTGQKPNVAHLREFGCDVWVLDESKNRSKLSPKSKKMKFTGFMDGSKSIRYYDAATRSIKISRNFAFNENDELQELEIYTEVPGLQAEGEQELSDDFANPETPNIPPIIETQPPTPKNTTNPITETPTRPVREGRKDLDYRVINNPRAQPSRCVPTQTEPLNVSRPTAASSAKRRPRETTHIAHQSIFDALSRQSLEDPEWLPQTCEEAMKCDEGPEWEKAIDEEYNQLIERGTWHLEQLPIGREAIGCKWVFDRKKDEKGNIVKYKARLVAQGFSQKPGVDYMDTGTFAPVMRFETLQ
jgi:Reverse transcriptase (RNA-dependent DNA polymerase)